MNKRVRRVVRMAFACAILMVILMSPATARAETASTRVRFFQQYRVDMSGLPNTFGYRITRQDSSAPYPTDENGSTIETFSLRRDDDTWLTFSFDEDELTETGTLIFRYKAAPVTTELEYGLYYVDLLSTDLRAGVNVYYIEIYVVVANDGSIEEIIPTVHVEGWDGPKVSDPGWRINWDEGLYSLLNADGYWNSRLPMSDRRMPLDGGGYSYVPGGSAGSVDMGSDSSTNASNGNGSGNATGNASSSDAASGGGAGGRPGGTGDATAGTGSASHGGNASAGTGVTSDATGSTGSRSSTTTSADGASSNSVAGATSGTSVTGGRNGSDGLATTADPTSRTLPVSIASFASLLLAAVFLRHRLQMGERQ